MKHYPIFFDLTHQHCLVIGGGKVAARKIKSLLRHSCSITLYSAEVNDKIESLLSDERIHYIANNFGFDNENAFETINKATLVFAATNNSALNKAISDYAKQHNKLVNVADNGDEGNFILPSIVDRSPVIIATSTGGSSPVLARQIRLKLETLIPHSYGKLAEITEKYRERVKAHFPLQPQRKSFWESLLNGKFADLVFADQTTNATQHIETLLKKKPSSLSNQGEVYLVGAGPGDPDLLTLKAVRLMQQAEVIIYDRLVSLPILELANPDAQRLYVGKKKSNHAVEQGSINEILVQFAKEGKRVLRLKGGDPFIFGRGGEEIQHLVEHTIPFQVVPAVTAALGCASYAGIPLTHRDYAQSVTFATGHLKDGSIDLNWQSLVQKNHTIVIYMGLTGIKEISKQLQAHGMNADMPAALIERGTTRKQKAHIGTIANLPDLVANADVKPPTLMIIGDVVKLHDVLKWYEPERHVPLTDFSEHQ